MVDLVQVSSDVFLACLAHTLTTDAYEVMGLLIGSYNHQHGKCVANVNATLVLQRSDKRNDRVEIPVEQLCNASEYAEKVGNGMQIIGWYHSHPHITVNPSHVDVRTQGNYQSLDERFIGLIFSAFSSSNDRKKMTPEEVRRPGKIEMICFQEFAGEAKYVPVDIIPADELYKRPCMHSLQKLPEVLLEEEQNLFTKALQEVNCELTKHENISIFNKALCNIMSDVSAPLLELLSMISSRMQRELDKAATKAVNTPLVTDL